MEKSYPYLRLYNGLTFQAILLQAFEKQNNQMKCLPMCQKCAFVNKHVETYSHSKDVLGPKGPQGSLIFISLALSQTPAYTARPHVGPTRLVHHVVCRFTIQHSLVLTAPTYGGMARLS